MMERLRSVELDDARFMSDWNLYYTFPRAKRIRTVCTIPVVQL